MSKTVSTKKAATTGNVSVSSTADSLTPAAATAGLHDLFADAIKDIYWQKTIW